MDFPWNLLRWLVWSYPQSSTANLSPGDRISQTDETRAREILFKYRDKSFSYVDASSFAAADICLEVSSAGLRKPVGEIYPSSQLLGLAARHGVPVTLASDAHHPRDVSYAFPQLIGHARAAGYSRVAVFAGRRRRLEPLGDAALNGAG